MEQGVAKQRAALTSAFIVLLVASVASVASVACAPSPPRPPPPQQGPPPGYYYPPPPPPGYAPPPAQGPAPAPVAAGAVGSPCAAEGGYGCTPDRRGLTICRGGRAALASTCRGQRGCSVGNAVDCDHSVAMVGDACDGPKEIACSMDAKSLLRCSGGVYQFGEPCRNACLSTSGRVLCQ